MNVLTVNLILSFKKLTSAFRAPLPASHLSKHLSPFPRNFLLAAEARETLTNVSRSNVSGKIRTLAQKTTLKPKITTTPKPFPPLRSQGRSLRRVSRLLGNDVITACAGQTCRAHEGTFLERLTKDDLSGPDWRQKSPISARLAHFYTWARTWRKMAPLNPSPTKTSG